MPQKLTNEKSILVHVTVMQQAITWAIADLDLCHHVASLDHKALINHWMWCPNISYFHSMLSRHAPRMLGYPTK